MYMHKKHSTAQNKSNINNNHYQRENVYNAGRFQAWNCQHKFNGMLSLS